MLQDMNTIKTVQKLGTQIAQIKTLLQRHGAMRPGSLSRQYNVCGKPGCRCKDRAHPRRHGPYYQLNYVYRGKRPPGSSAEKSLAKCGPNWPITKGSDG